MVRFLPGILMVAMLCAIVFSILLVTSQTLINQEGFPALERTWHD